MCIMVDYPHALEASRNMGDYFTVLLAERRQQAPGDDLVGMLAHAEVDGERLPDAVAISFLRQLMNAAGDTTYRSTGSLLVGLLTHPEQLDAVRADRSLVPRAVDEALRWEGPLTVLTRQAMRDVELDGVAVASGTKIDVVQGSANRDPSRYLDPDRFDISRPPPGTWRSRTARTSASGSTSRASRCSAHLTRYWTGCQTCGSIRTLRRRASSASTRARRKPFMFASTRPPESAAAHPSSPQSTILS